MTQRSGPTRRDRSQLPVGVLLTELRAEAKADSSGNIYAQADCPVCSQAMRFDRYGARCYAGCDEDEIVDRLLAIAHGVEEREQAEAARAPARLLRGASFVLDTPEGVPAVWGRGDTVAWAKGEPLFIVGPQGAGKTTLAGQLALRRHGVGDQAFLGMPVETDPRRVLYLACDRPRQVARSFRRMVTERDRSALESFLVWTGPLPFDVAGDPDRLATFATELEVGTVFIDSLKDVALDLSKDETGSRVNRALQGLLAADIEVAVLHHQRKSQATNSKPRTLSDVYGSGWLTAGAGSVLLLWGEPGDNIVELRHLKQPAEDIGPLKVFHDHERGVSTVHEPVNLWTLVQASNGLTAADAARAIFDTADPKPNEVERARRKLDRLVVEGIAGKRDGGPRKPVEYVPAELRAVA